MYSKRVPYLDVNSLRQLGNPHDVRRRKIENGEIFRVPALDRLTMPETDSSNARRMPPAAPKKATDGQVRSSRTSAWTAVAAEDEAPASRSDEYSVRIPCDRTRLFQSVRELDVGTH